MSRIVDDFNRMFPLKNKVELPDPLHGTFVVCSQLVHDVDIPNAIKEKIIRRTIEQFPDVFCGYTNYERDLNRYHEFVFDVNMLIYDYEIRCAPYALG